MPYYLAFSSVWHAVSPSKRASNETKKAYSSHPTDLMWDES
jgi:hypothetical protein